MLLFLVLVAALGISGCPDRSMTEARDLEASGKLAEAGRAYVTIAKLDPANLAAWDAAIRIWCTRLVHVGECMGVLDLELDRLGNLHRHKDALAEALEHRARARLEQGLAKAALADLERAEKASPERSAIFAVRAKALMMLGEPEEAITSLKRARRLDPSEREAEDLFKDLPSTR